MQTFIAELTKPISDAAFREKWAEESSGRPKVDFVFHGLNMIATVHSGPITPWEKENFCQFLRLIVHNVDSKCDVNRCSLKD